MKNKLLTLARNCWTNMIKVADALGVNRRVVTIALKYGLGISLLIWMIWRHWAPATGPGLSGVWQKYVIEHHPANLGPFALACGISAFGMMLTFIRWYVLVRAQHLPFTLPNAFRLGLIGYSLSIFLPGSIGGDIIKAAFIAREQSRRTLAVATVIIDRAIGLWGLCGLVALLGTTFWAGGFLQGMAETVLKSIVITALVLMALSLAVWFLLGALPPYRAERFAGRLERLPKIGHALAELWRAVWVYRCKGRSILIAFLLSLLGHVGFVLTFYFAALTLLPARNIPSVAEHFLIVPIGMTVQAGFPTPGGVGAGQVVYSTLYEWVGRSGDDGMLASLVGQIITWGLGLVGYIVYLRMRPALASSEASLAAEPPPVEGVSEPEFAVSESEDPEQEIETTGQPQLMPEP